MAYTVRRLAKLSGVSIRTLHFYDEIGLLKPAYYGDNGYRYYEEEQLLLLQQILFYRKLNLPLSEIQDIVTSDSFDKIEALQEHKRILEKDLVHTGQLIKTIEKTIAHLQGVEKMREEEMFDSLKLRESQPQQEYERYLVEKNILSKEELDQSWNQVKHWNKSDFDEYQEQGNTLYKKFAEATQAKQSASCKEVQNLMVDFYQLIKPFWTFDQKSFVELGEMYCTHPGFRKFFEGFHPNLPEFLAEAMKVFAKTKLH